MRGIIQRMNFSKLRFMSVFVLAVILASGASAQNNTSIYEDSNSISESDIGTHQLQPMQDGFIDGFEDGDMDEWEIAGDTGGYVDASQANPYAGSWSSHIRVEGTNVGEFVYRGIFDWSDINPVSSVTSRIYTLDDSETTLSCIGFDDEGDTIGTVDIAACIRPPGKNPPEFSFIDRTDGGFSDNIIGDSIDTEEYYQISLDVDVDSNEATAILYYENGTLLYEDSFTLNADVGDSTMSPFHGAYTTAGTNHDIYFDDFIVGEAEPEVTNLGATEVGSSSAILNADVESLGSYNYMNASFYYREFGGTINDWVQTDEINISDTGNYSIEIGGLQDNTTYEFYPILNNQSDESDSYVDAIRHNFTTQEYNPFRNSSATILETINGSSINEGDLVQIGEISYTHVDPSVDEIDFRYYLRYPNGTLIDMGFLATPGDDVSEFSIGQTQSGFIDWNTDSVPSEIWNEHAGETLNISIAITDTGNFERTVSDYALIDIQVPGEGGVIYDAVSAALNPIQDLLDSLIDIITDLLDSVISTLEDLLGSVVDFLQDIINALWNALSWIANALLAILVTIVDFIVTIIGYILTILINIIQYLIFNITDIDYEYQNQTYDHLNETPANIIDILDGEIRLNGTENQADEFDSAFGTEDKTLITWREEYVLFSHEFGGNQSTNETEQDVSIDDRTYSVSLPFPKLFDPLGVPAGTVVVVNFLIMISAFVMSIIPDPIVDLSSAFLSSLGAILDAIIMILGYTVSAINWALNEGTQYIYYGLMVGAFAKLIHYWEMFEDRNMSMAELINYIINDIINLFDTAVRLAVAAQDIANDMFKIMIHIINTIRGIIRGL